MKVLLADDSEVLRKAVVKLLEPQGFHIVEAVDGVEAITRFYEEQPGLVLLDITMPRMTGYVVCRLIKEDPVLGHTPVLILTSRDQAEDRYWAERSGADGYITKDALGDGLVQSIRSAVARHALFELNASPSSRPPALGEADVLTRVCGMLDRHLFEATVIGEITALATVALELEPAIALVLDHLRRVVRFDVGGVALTDVATLFAYAGEPVADPDADEVVAFAMRHLNAVLGGDAPRCEIRWFGDPEADSQTAAYGWGSTYAAALRAGGETVGVLVLASRNHGAFPDSTVRTLHTVEPALGGVLASLATRTGFHFGRADAGDDVVSAR